MKLLNNLNYEKNKLIATKPFIWLVEVQIDTTNAIRFASYDEVISFNGYTWYPYPLSIGNIQEDSEGKVQTVELSIGSIDRKIIGYVKAGGINGQTCKIILTHESYLNDPSSSVERKFEILSLSYDDTNVTLSLGIANLISTDFPSERFYRGDCRYAKEYTQERCGYPAALATGQFSTCNGTLAACTARGLNEAAYGYVKKHPSRYGGFPGIPEGTLAV